MGPDFEKVMVSRVEIYPLRWVTVSHPTIYCKVSEGKSQVTKIPPQIYPLEVNFLWYPGSQDPRNLVPCQSHLEKKIRLINFFRVLVIEKLLISHTVVLLTFSSNGLYRPFKNENWKLHGDKFFC